MTAGLQDIAAKLEAMPRKKKDRTALGLGLYALSSCFLATMLMFAKKLGELISDGDASKGQLAACTRTLCCAERTSPSA